MNIEVSDDGAGIDPNTLRRKAVERGLISAEQVDQMSDQDALNMIFLPGFSTAKVVTNISGRGVGMDVVKTNIEKIGGNVTLVSSPGRGTSVRVMIPLTLAIIPGLIVKAGGQRFVILRSELIPKVKQFFISRSATPAMPEPIRRNTVSIPRDKVAVVAIGVSTGGPQALAEVIPHIPGNLRVPILIVQHMPAMFTRLLAERLQASSALQVKEAVDGMEVLPGQAIIARGDYHLTVHRKGSSVFIELDQNPRINFCRPSVDVLFRSLVNVYGNKVLSVMLTGMGADGLKGTEELRTAGAYSLVQDEASSVVWGMPGAVVNAGLADQVVPLERIAPEIIRLVTG